MDAETFVKLNHEDAWAEYYRMIREGETVQAEVFRKAYWEANGKTVAMKPDGASSVPSAASTAMKVRCEHCREEIASDAKVCPHCRRDTSLGQKEKGGRFWKWVAIIIGVPIGGFIILAMLGSQLPDEKPSERIEKACKEQYLYDEQARLTCMVALETKMIDDQERQKMEDAARAAGVKP